jgi:hypothetical protein
MKQNFLILILLITLLSLIGCTSDPDASATKNVSSASTANTNSSSPQDSGAGQKAEPQVVDPSQRQTAGVTKDSPQWLLQGTYAIAEVHHEGIVDMIKAETTTEIIFKPPSSFSRLSKKDGKVYHSDSGQYNIEGDTLILQIVVSNKQIQQPAVVKRHKLSISPDGNEFKLTSDKNNTAVFRRIKS